MNVIQEAADLFKDIESSVREKECYLKFTVDPSLSLSNKIFTDVPLTELSRFVPEAPEKKTIGCVSVCLIDRIVRVMNECGESEDFLIFGNE